MNTAAFRPTLVFALPDGGGQQLASLLANDSTLCATEALGSLLLPAIHALRTRGTDADYDALSAARNNRAFISAHPNFLPRWQAAQYALASAVVDTLAAEAPRPSAVPIIDHFAGNHFGAADLAELLPDAPAVIVVPHPIGLLGTAYAHSECDEAQLRQDEARYRDLSLGPACITEALQAFASRALIIDQAFLEAKPADTLAAIAAFARNGEQRIERMPTVPASVHALATDPTFNVLLARYLAHLSATLPALGITSDEALAEWHTLRKQAMLDGVLAGLNLARLQSFGLPPEQVAETVIVHLDPEHNTGIPEAALHDLAIQLNAIGEGLFEEGALAEANAAIRFATELHPAFPQAISNLGVLAWQAGSTQQAIAHFMQAYSIDSSSRATLDNLIGALTTQGENIRAKSILSHYLSLHPEDEEMFTLFLQL